MKNKKTLALCEMYKKHDNWYVNFESESTVCKYRYENHDRIYFLI